MNYSGTVKMYVRLSGWHAMFMGAYLVPKRSVDRLSGAFDGLGEQQHSNAALELPPWKRSSVYKSHMILNLVDILLFQKR